MSGLKRRSDGSLKDLLLDQPDFQGWASSQQASVPGETRGIAWRHGDKDGDTLFDLFPQLVDIETHHEDGYTVIVFNDVRQFVIMQQRRGESFQAGWVLPSADTEAEDSSPSRRKHTIGGLQAFLKSVIKYTQRTKRSFYTNSWLLTEKERAKNSQKREHSTFQCCSRKVTGRPCNFNIKMYFCHGSNTGFYFAEESDTMLRSLAGKTSAEGISILQSQHSAECSFRDQLHFVPFPIERYTEVTQLALLAPHPPPITPKLPSIASPAPQKKRKTVHCDVSPITFTSGESSSDSANDSDYYENGEITPSDLHELMVFFNQVNPVCFEVTLSANVGRVRVYLSPSDNFDKLFQICRYRDAAIADAVLTSDCGEINRDDVVEDFVAVIMCNKNNLYELSFVAESEVEQHEVTSSRSKERAASVTVRIMDERVRGPYCAEYLLLDMKKNDRMEDIIAIWNIYGPPITDKDAISFSYRDRGYDDLLTTQTLEVFMEEHNWDLNKPICLSLKSRAAVKL